MSEDMKQIYTLMSKVMASVGAIGKTGENKDQGYGFRSIDDVYNGAHGALVANGVFVVPEVLEERSESVTSRNGGHGFRVVLRVKHTFYAPDGSSVIAVTVGESVDYSDKATNQAMSAAYKYAICESLCIPTGDKDADAASPEAGQAQASQKPAQRQDQAQEPQQDGKEGVDDLLAQMDAQETPDTPPQESNPPDDDNLPF